MNTTHTPGPWFVKPTGIGGFEILNMPDSQEAAVLCVHYAWGETDGEVLANAHLIAAAPDLLAATQAFIKYDHDGINATDHAALMLLYADALRLAKVAIAKATGEPA